MTYNVCNSLIISYLQLIYLQVKYLQLIYLQVIYLQVKYLQVKYLQVIFLQLVKHEARNAEKFFSRKIQRKACHKTRFRAILCP